MGGGSSKKPVEPPAANESGGSGGSGKKKKKGKGKKKGKDGGDDPAVSTGAGLGDDPGGAIRVESLPLEDEDDIERDAAADLPVESRGDRRRGSSSTRRLGAGGGPGSGKRSGGRGKARRSSARRDAEAKAADDDLAAALAELSGSDFDLGDLDLNSDGGGGGGGAGGENDGGSQGRKKRKKKKRRGGGGANEDEREPPRQTTTAATTTATTMPGASPGSQSQRGHIFRDDDEFQTRIFAHESGEVFKTRTLAATGEVFYMNTARSAWEPFPDAWLAQGEFRDSVVFRTWTRAADNVEFITFQEDGVSYYCDLTRSEWTPFPSAWLGPEVGRFGPETDPNAWIARQNEQLHASDPRIGTFTDENTGLTYTTCVAEEKVKVYFYAKGSKWERMPRAWIRQYKRQRGEELDENDFDGSSGGRLDHSTPRGTAATPAISAYQGSDEYTASLENKVSELEVRLAETLSLMDDMAEQSAQVERARRETERRDQQSQHRDEEMAAANRRIRDLEQTVATLEAENAEVRRQAEESVRLARREVEQLAQGGSEALEQTIAIKDAAISDLQDEVRRLTTAVAQVEQRASSVDRLGGTVLVLSQQLRALKAEQAATTDAAWNMQTEFNAALRATTKTLAEGVRVASNRVEEYRAKYRSESIQRKILYNKVQELRGNIRVYCRARGGFDEDYLADPDNVCVRFGRDGEVVSRDPETEKERVFEFDAVFPSSARQAAVFDDMEPLITSVLDGYNVSVFAYGQTGAGKTYTMMGPDHDRGVNLRALSRLFALCDAASADVAFRITVQYIEIYNETIRDLLNPMEQTKAGWGGKSKDVRKYTIRQGPQGMYVPDLETPEVGSVEDVLSVIARGEAARATEATDMNEVSSRSHSLLMVFVEGEDLISRTVSHGKLTLIDLAGSERVKRSNAEGQRFEEAKAINKSLSALGSVIAALQSKSKHVPFRNSKLTTLMQDSLGGNSKVLLFVAINPSAENFSETYNTLQFGERARTVVLGRAAQNKSKLPALPAGAGGGVASTSSAAPARRGR